MARPRQVPVIKRRTPRQARATETVGTILEAAAQVLEAGGLAAFTTNAVAERAGVSIGTLYQYFADKDAILRAVAEHELRATLARVATAMTEEHGASSEQRVRAIVHAIINAFSGRQRARKAVVQAVLSQGGGAIFQAPISGFIAANALDTLSEQQTFVVSRAILGVIRSAVVEEQRFLTSRSFEDEVVRLVLAYLGAVRARPASTEPE